MHTLDSITFLIGLPGSGKSTYLLQQNPTLIQVYDEPSDLNLVSWDGMSREIIIASPYLTNTKTLGYAEEFIKSKFPQTPIKRIYFENNPKQCIINVSTRLDGRNVVPDILVMSKFYMPIGPCIPVYGSSVELDNFFNGSTQPHKA